MNVSFHFDLSYLNCCIDCVYSNILFVYKAHRLSHNLPHKWGHSLLLPRIASLFLHSHADDLKVISVIISLLYFYAFKVAKWFHEFNKVITCDNFVATRWRIRAILHCSRCSNWKLIIALNPYKTKVSISYECIQIMR